MTNTEKLERLRLLMGLRDRTEDDALLGFLDFTRDEILSWEYRNMGGVPESVTDVSREYEGVQLNACMIGFNHRAAEGQSTHSENGISRSFSYADCLEYIHRSVLPFVGVIS